jgi:hypothetical protein
MKAESSMPLIKSKSKKAFSKNVETEMKAHPGDPKKDLAIAYSVKRKAKKKASGGTVESGSRDMNYADGGEAKNRLHQGAQEARKYDAQKSEKGVHTPKFAYPGNKQSMGESQAGYYTKSGGGVNSRTGEKVSQQDMNEDAKEMHRNKLDELRKMPKPKFAEGGEVTTSASNEKRPTTSDTYKDKKNVSQNSGNKPSKNDSWTDNSTVKQAQKISTTPLSRPKMVGTDAYSVRSRDMRDDEADAMDRMAPTTDRAQPPQRDNEDDAKAMGSDPDMAKQHNNGKAPYNKAIEDQYAQDVAAAEFKKTQSYANGGQVDKGISNQGKWVRSSNEHKEAGYPDSAKSAMDEAKYDIKNEHYRTKQMNPKLKGLAEGGEINDFEPMEDAENDNVVHPEGLESDDDSMGPAKKEYMADHMQMLAEGGIADEEEIEHAASIAAAIMARRKMASGGTVESGSEDMNYADGGPVDEDPFDDDKIVPRYADGGPVDEDPFDDDKIVPRYADGGQIENNDDGEVDLSLNSTEQPNEYPPMNGEALDWDDDADYLDKEQPEDSNETGDEREDETSDPHGKSLASKIRAKTKASKKSPITR